MNRRTFIQQLGLGLGSCLATRCWGDEKSNEPVRRPNIVIFLTDDQGYGDTGFGPHSTGIATPNLNRLARMGVTFTQGYAAPMCTPSRVQILSGQYHGRLGIYDVSGDAGVGFPQDAKIAPQYFKDMGYRTACIGKWHVGGELPGFEYNHPLNRGFDRFWGFMGSTHDYWKADTGSGFNTTGYTSCGYNPIYDQHDPVERVRYLTYEIADQSIEFVNQAGQEPFFLYIPHHCSHVPLHAPEELVKKYEALGLADNATVTRAMYEALDDGLGRLLDALERNGQMDNTLFIFSSDNGGSEPCAQLNHNLRGGKFSLLEGGIRVPTVMAWPGCLPADRIYHNPVINMDFLPTALAAVGAELNPKFEGVNLLPYLTGRRHDRPHETLHWMMPPETQEFAVRHGDWKLVYTSVGRGLFNLQEDPRELHDRSADRPDLVAKLQQLQDQWTTKNKPAVFTPELRKRFWKMESDNEKDNRHYVYTRQPHP